LIGQEFAIGALGRLGDRLTDIPEAVGNRLEIPATDFQGNNIGSYNNFGGNRAITLHGIDQVTIGLSALYENGQLLSGGFLDSVRAY
jgi:hypothetical protein